jgi:actin-like protein 6A
LLFSLSSFPLLSFLSSVKNWDVLEQLWDHLFAVQLRLNPTEHPILLAEASFNTKPLREKSTEIMFEKYKIPALFVSKNAVLTSYPNNVAKGFHSYRALLILNIFSSGKATSLVLDSGGGVTSCVPVNDGYVLKKGI